MARMPRVVVPGYPHHVIQRGNRRQRTFFCIDDYHYYLKLISRYCKEAETEVWAYCLMPNHVHLVMVPSSEDGLRAALAETHRRYTRHINIREGWQGHLWQERFRSFLMDEDYLRSTVRYVERNPVAARLCIQPQDWKWSSASAHMEGNDDLLVRVKPMLDRIDDWKAYLTKRTSQDEISLINRHSRTGRPLGNTSFVQKLEQLTGRDLTPGRPGPKKKGES